MSQTRNPALILLTAVVLACAWLLWSGKYEPLFYGLGALSVVVSLVLSVRMGLFRSDSFLLGLLLRAPLYFVWLAWEALTSAWSVAKICLDPQLPISPKVVTVDPEWSSPTGITTLGNSITFTPGTVTLDVSRRGRLHVHCLTLADAEELASGSMNARVGRLAPRRQAGGRATGHPMTGHQTTGPTAD